MHTYDTSWGGDGYRFFSFFSDGISYFGMVVVVVFFMTNPMVIFVFYFGDLFLIFLVKLFFTPKIAKIPLFGYLEPPLFENRSSVSVRAEIFRGIFRSSGA
jgi:hypothetical protein